MSVIEPEVQLPRFNDARAIPIFRDSWKNKQPDESHRQTWCYCSSRYPLCRNSLPANIRDCNTSQAPQFYFRLIYSRDSSTGKEVTCEGQQAGRTEFDTTKIESKRNTRTPLGRFHVLIPCVFSRRSSPFVDVRVPLEGVSTKCPCMPARESWSCNGSRLAGLACRNMQP
jgi:hypothetical protein